MTTQLPQHTSGTARHRAPVDPAAPPAGLGYPPPEAYGVPAWATVPQQQGPAAQEGPAPGRHQQRVASPGAAPAPGTAQPPPGPQPYTAPRQHAAQPYPGQPYPGQPYPGQPYPAPQPSGGSHGAPQGPGRDGHGRHGQAPASGSNGVATSGFVVALVGAVMALIPLVGVVSWALCPIGLVLSAVGLGLARRRGAGRGLAITGVVLGVVGLLLCSVWIAAFDSTVRDTSPTTSGAVPAVGSATPASSSAVRYEVTGSGEGMVTYTDGTGNIGQETSASLPWTKDVAPQGLLGFYSVSVTSTDGGEVGCRIVKDGAVIAQQTASGSYATASCSGG